MNTPLQKGALITSDTPYTVLKIWVVIWALPWNGTVWESGIWRLLWHHPSSLLTEVKFWTWGLIMNFSCWVRKQPSRYQLLSITLLAEQRAKFSLGSFTKVLDVCRFLGYFIWLVWCLTHSLRSVAATPAPTSCSKKGLNWKKAKKKKKINTRLRSYSFPLENTVLHTLDKKVWILSLSCPGPGIKVLPLLWPESSLNRTNPTLLLPS